MGHDSSGTQQTTDNCCIPTDKDRSSPLCAVQAATSALQPLSVCDRHHMAHKAPNIYYLNIHRKSLQTLLCPLVFSTRKDTWLRQPVRTTYPFPAMDSFLQWVQSVKQNHVLVNGALNWRDGGFSFHKGSVCESLKPTWLLCTQELCVSQLATVLSILESDHDKRVVPSIKISSLHKDQAIYYFYYFFIFHIILLLSSRTIKYLTERTYTKCTNYMLRAAFTKSNMAKKGLLPSIIAMTEQIQMKKTKTKT